MSSLLRLVFTTFLLYFIAGATPGVFPFKFAAPNLDSNPFQLALWPGNALQELFLWDPSYNISISSSPVNATCSSRCSDVGQTFKDCVIAANETNVAACLCTDAIGTKLGSCVSCISAETSSFLLNATVKIGARDWTYGCNAHGHNVSQPQVNATQAALAVAGSALPGISVFGPFLWSSFVVASAVWIS
ncbi:hypothetical protein FB45DRAFT_1126035 [Roridomyces roridus]|uniref:Uncharacterized protein n=1 Tax=Roridomyces roridus TaxID=1738132 RepID=A0AAD7FWP4_9AGAR|nr:hypothetical protein FB45DRAFT_1126035 [Roridomyces roridus]